MGRFILNPEIMQMLVNFYRVSGMRVGVHDVDMSIITDYPHENATFDRRKFCEKNKRLSKPYWNKCDRCDETAFEYARATGKPYVYRCHMGFMVAVIPIMAGGETFCFLMIGQVRCGEGSKETPEQTRKWIEEQFRLYKIPEEKYPMDKAIEDYERMPCMDFEKFRSYVYFLELCAQKIYNDDYVSRSERSVSKELMKFVNANLYNDIAINDFSKSMGLSSSYLSHTISKEMGTTFTKYLNLCRMEEAKRLLRVTDMSVKKISVLLRYNDVAYFVKQFKRITGMTCTDYRISKNGQGKKK